ncbi:NADPH:quinone oxidoreductase family protein [Pseudogemmobacter sonorensis]|uniref:NADPH:quinone oxidoreductase family protein n=1 Tax=Pseudogemmobacter sonorensis TaxID=2989681 RepID=UPI00369606AF
MKAAVVHDFAPYRSLALDEVAAPTPGPGEVVIAVEASEVNFPDILQVEGRYQTRAALPFVPGLGAVGRVLRLGEGVAELAPGQRVLTLPDGGTHAEEARVPARWCWPVPEDIPADIGAALGLAYQTAWFALTARAGLRPGERVLVTGATGGVGMAAVQLARALGAGQVIAATRGAAGGALARDLGADAALDSAAPDLVESLRAGVRALTGGSGVDVVIDPVGGTTGEAAFRTLGWEGRFVTLGYASGAVPGLKANHLLVKNVAVLGLQWTDYRARHPERVAEAQARIFALWREGRLAPRISHRLPLARVAEALERMEQGQAQGKIVLLPGR